MKLVANLNTAERAQLLKFPAYISLLAANADGKMDDAEKKEAIRLTHIKTYSSPPSLSEFYKKAEIVFLKNINELDSKLPQEKKARENIINRELAKINELVNKLGKEYVRQMKRSMLSYRDHVSKAHHNIFEYVLFPIPVKGLTE